MQHSKMDNRKDIHIPACKLSNKANLHSYVALHNPLGSAQSTTCLKTLAKYSLMLTNSILLNNSNYVPVVWGLTSQRAGGS